MSHTFIRGTSMRRITTFRSTTDRIYDGKIKSKFYPVMSYTFIRRTSMRRITTFRSTTGRIYDGKIKWSRYRPGLAQKMGRGIALLFHDSGTRRGWVVSSTPRLHFTPGRDPIPILQEAEWAPGTVWTGGKSRPHRDSIPDRPARCQSLYRLS